MIKRFLKRIIPKTVQKNTFFLNVYKRKFSAIPLVALLVCLCIVISISACGANEDIEQQTSDNTLLEQSEENFASENIEDLSNISSLISSEKEEAHFPPMHIF